eukprot:TRINITY_DN9472_c0_g1_i1.p1 TRINITY_DN9472_c0_g1~~TRINITY_DN9472_c0_g1_i1.p1  ORF type:complete len:249 (+),score=49.67 TRINITY_DN9472_c0_g1_i1:203-949(+)
MFSVLLMKHYTSIKKLIKKTNISTLNPDRDSFQSAYVKGKNTPCLRDLFADLLPPFKELSITDRAMTSSISKDSSSGLESPKRSLELDREDWLKQRTQVPVGNGALDSALRHIQQNPFEFSEAGKLGTTTPSLRDRPVVTPARVINDDDEAFGPSLVPEVSSGSKLPTASGSRSRKDEWDRVRNKQEQQQSQPANDQAQAVQREEWMTSLPHLGMRPSLDVLTNRKFSTKITEPVREEDRKGWIAKKH